MRAVVHDRYGPPDVLRLEDVERPVPKEGEVLVRIHATTVNQTDCHIRRARPFVWRFYTGLLRPKRRILGMELAGEVEAVGAGVAEFEVGDRVFGVTDSGAKAGEYRAVIDRTYPLEAAVEATKYVETWQKTGNVVLTLNDGPPR